VEVNTLAAKIKKAISTDFMTPFINDWPFKPIQGKERGRRESKSVISEGEDEDDSVNMSDYDEKHTAVDDDAVWGPPWSDCVVGKFAVLRCEIGTPSKFGVCVIKVVQKDAEILNGEYPVRKLYGKEYLCTLSNIEPRCVRNGKWNWHSNRSTVEEYDNYNVLAYFDRLNEGALPLTVAQTIEHTHATKPVFY
jgi:hypothetical protein